MQTKLCRDIHLYIILIYIQQNSLIFFHRYYVFLGWLLLIFLCVFGTLIPSDALVSGRFYVYWCCKAGEDLSFLAPVSLWKLLKDCKPIWKWFVFSFVCATRFHITDSGLFSYPFLKVINFAFIALCCLEYHVILVRSLVDILYLVFFLLRD